MVNALGRFPRMARRGLTAGTVFSRTGHMAAANRGQVECIRSKAAKAFRAVRRETMKVRTRFIRSVIEAAQTEAVDLPWARGPRRGQTLSHETGVLRLPYAKIA